MKHLYLRLLCMAILALTTGCEHKELCYEHPHTMQLDVIFDWGKAPGASPGSMSLYLFPADGGKPLRYEFASCKGGTIQVPAGRYEALCLNSDTEGIYYRDTEKRCTFEVTTRSTTIMPGLSAAGTSFNNIPRAEGAEDERVALPPQDIWSDYAESIVLAPGAGSASVTFYPEISVHNYTIEIRNAENLKYVSAVSASISSMAGGMLPGLGHDILTEERVTIPFGVSISADQTVVTGKFKSFGHCPSDHNRHKLVVYTVLADNSNWYYTYDVTEVVHTAPDKKNVHILLEELPLPKPIVDDGGFNPSVDDWQDIEVDIEM